MKKYSVEEIVICNNHECENWKHKNDYIAWGDNKLDLDKTNCSIHSGEELVEGDCKDVIIREEEHYERSI